MNSVISKQLSAVNIKFPVIFCAFVSAFAVAQFWNLILTEPIVFRFCVVAH